jgi:hypothetical protein
MSDEAKKTNGRQNDEDLVEVTRVWEATEAEIIKGFLESEGIPCYFRGQILHSLYPIFVDGLGEIKIFVPKKDLKTALALLKTREIVPENPT